MPRLQIDTLRGLACVLLVFYHVIGNDPSTGLRIQDGGLRWFNDELAYLRMPLFTVLSGLVYGLRPFAGDSGKFLSGKARRLLVPMLVVGTFFAVLQDSVAGTNAPDHNWWLLHLEPVGHFWFVQSLFWVFVGLWLLERAQWLGDGRRFAGVFAGVIALHLSFGGSRWLGIEGAVYLAPYFMAGLAVTRFAWHGQLSRRAVQGLLLALALLAVVKLGWPQPDIDRRSGWALMAGMSLCGLALSLRFSWQWLARLGANSYAIYLFHVFFTAAARIALEKIGVSEIAVHAAAGLLLGLVGPMVVEAVAARKRWSGLLLLGRPLAPRVAVTAKPLPLA